MCVLASNFIEKKFQIISFNCIITSNDFSNIIIWVSIFWFCFNFWDQRTKLLFISVRGFMRSQMMARINIHTQWLQHHRKMYVWWAICCSMRRILCGDISMGAITKLYNMCILRILKTYCGKNGMQFLNILLIRSGVCMAKIRRSISKN